MSIFSRLKIGTKLRSTPAEFWDWFQSDEGKQTIQTVSSQDDRRSKDAQSALQRAIHRVHPELVWGMRPPDLDGSPGVLEISAGGMKAMIPVVESLVEAAPALPEWNVVAFKQPMPEFVLTIGANGESMDPKSVLVQPQLRSDGRFDVGVFVPTPAGFPKNAVAEIGFIMLDHVLGEYVVMTRIAELHFDSTLVCPPGAISIAEFASQLRS